MATAENLSIPRNRKEAWVALLLIAIPPAVFYFLVLKSQTNIPFLDDYGSVLDFMLALKQANVLGKLVLIVMAQHNEYRLAFENAIFALQYGILGHADIKSLSLLGDLFIIPIFGVLYLIWRQVPGSGDRTLLAFVPVSWILFQLQYASALNCAMTPLQNLTVIFFVLLSLYLGTKSGSLAFAGACFSLVLAVASSGNGLFLIPVGAIMFLQRREYRRLVTWILTGSLLCMVYFYKYNFNSRQRATGADSSVLASLRHLSPIWAASFLGSTAAIRNVIPAVLLGVAFVILFVWATRDKLFNSNPTVYYAMLFFLFTAIVASGMRSQLGLLGSIGSRYRITSTVMLILAFYYLLSKIHHLGRATLIVTSCILAVGLTGFTLISDREGYKLLLIRRAKLEAGMYRWEHNLPRPVVQDTDIGDEMNIAAHEKRGWYEPEEPTLSDAINAGIYRVPQMEIDRAAGQ